MAIKHINPDTNFTEAFNPEPIPKTAYTNNTLWNYRLGVYHPTVFVYSGKSWEVLPVPRDGLSFVVTTLVTEGRSAKGVVVGEQIGRDQIKMDNLVFPSLYAHEWERVLSLLKFGVKTKFKYYDMSAQKEIVRYLYPGDRTATVFSYAPYILSGESTCRPQVLVNCSVNLIDRGE